MVGVEPGRAAFSNFNCKNNLATTWFGTLLAEYPLLPFFKSDPPARAWGLQARRALVLCVWKKRRSGGNRSSFCSRRGIEIVSGPLHHKSVSGVYVIWVEQTQYTSGGGLSCESSFLLLH